MLRLPLRSYHKHAHAKASSPPAKRAASEPVSNNRCALGFNMVIVLHLCSEFLHDAPHSSAAHLVRMLVVCLLFSALPVHMSSRFLSWALLVSFLLLFTRFWAPRPENENNKGCLNRSLSWPHVGGLKWLQLRLKLASCWRPKLA